MGGVSQRVDLHSSFIWEGSLGGVHGRCLPLFLEMYS